jgi:aspartate aminotransferase-like enzyme
VTAVEVPSGITCSSLLARLREHYGVVMAGGQGDLAECIVRFGHLGWVHEPEVNEALDALAAALADLGYKVPAAAGQMARGAAD